MYTQRSHLSYSRLECIESVKNSVGPTNGIALTRMRIERNVSGAGGKGEKGGEEIEEG